MGVADGGPAVENLIHTLLPEFAQTVQGIQSTRCLKIRPRTFRLYGYAQQRARAVSEVRRKAPAG